MKSMFILLCFQSLSLGSQIMVVIDCVVWCVIQVFQMENELKQLEAHSLISEKTIIDELTTLSQQIIKDCQLKKGKKAKFIKHMEKINQIAPNLDAAIDEPTIVAAAALFKNIGKLGDHEQSLSKAIQLISKVQRLKAVMVRWLLQFAALKSSKKEHQDCYELAVKAFDLCQQILATKIKNSHQSQQSSQRFFVQKIVELSIEKPKDEIIWLVNERSLAEDMLQNIKKSVPFDLHIPYYPTHDFHIADYMSLQQCGRDWDSGQNHDSTKDVVIYLSICCFTMATERYYLKDFSQKYNHLKALKIALCAFDINCSYVAFLLKILNQHFGKRLESIEQEHFQTADRYELKRIMPKDPKEVNMKHIVFADQ